MNMHRIGRRAAAVGMLAALGACSTLGGLGNVLGGMVGRGKQAGQVTGYVQGVDTRSQIIALQQPNGQPVNLLFDSQTKVVYNNQSYAVTSLDRGDQVTARVQNTDNGYYTDVVQVERPVQGTAATTTSGNVQTVQGTVRQIDQQNGLFTMDVTQRYATHGLDAVLVQPHRRHEVPESALGRQRADRGGVSEQLAGGVEAVLSGGAGGAQRRSASVHRFTVFRPASGRRSLPRPAV